jgi:hypothetical protein
VVKRECRGFRLYLRVIVIIICEGSVLCEGRLHGTQDIFLCDCDIYLLERCPW